MTPALVNTTHIPSRTQILVIGGGPAGSYAATMLAREGLEVTLLEKDFFPRYHIGESLVPSVKQFLTLIDAEEIVSAHGFTDKPGAAVKLTHDSIEGYTDFIAIDPKNGSWNVVRSEFDEILLRHAAKNGVRVLEGVNVTKINFDPNSESPDCLRPISAEWQSKTLDQSGNIAFDWLVDASGRTGLMSTKYLRNRRLNSSLKNVACWGYWKGAGRYSPGTNRENAIWIEALTDQTGWCWFIPLHNGTVSVGFVMLEEASVKKKRGSDGTPSLSLKDHYLNQMQYAPGLVELLGDGTLESDIKAASDYSYSATSYAGDHYRIAGDAGSFIDPFFSSGVHLALTGGFSAACSLAASIRGDCPEVDAIKYHDLKVGTAYTRFLIVVLGAYKQMRAQDVPVLQDINEKNFDHAFTMIRSIIQGAGDVGRELTETEVQDAMDFCSGIFLPVSSETQSSVAKRLDPHLLSLDAPVMLPKEIEAILGEEDKESVQVVWRVNARKPIHATYADSVSQFGNEAFAGYVSCCGRGKLGLVRASE
ncbi:FAD/NAD-P-binding domain-containing protein [Cristinia sonorae]|uniref:FAD/NAD-P-binding domain-containing protein n=1 Tax=Cristinia sonorae TaxID=1940300 RepID=A0A8K0USA5_9AGAR|nr:FAD/NAD-P-binding domain-containing protein [Cristinia sonorae]